MKQKIVLDKGYLFKDKKEIKLSMIQEKILRTLQDNLTHSYSELIKRADILRGVGEVNTLRLHVLRLNTKTRLKIKTIRGQGYLLEDKIYVNN